MQKLSVVAVSCVVLLSSAIGQHASSPAAEHPISSESTHAVQNYEIVSIKPAGSGSTGGMMRNLPNGFEWTNITTEVLVQAAYGVIMDEQLEGMPSWGRSERYDIIAKVDTDTAERWKTLTAKERAAEELPLMRNLLAERLQLKAHLETKEFPVYDLVIAKSGPKLKLAAANEPSREEMTRRGELKAQSMGTDAIVYAFTGTLGRMIVDKTGLQNKKFDFELRWQPDNGNGGIDRADEGPSLFTALEEQLGLKLVSSKGPVNILVIDKIQRPSPN